MASHRESDVAGVSCEQNPTASVAVRHTVLVSRGAQPLRIGQDQRLVAYHFASELLYFLERGISVRHPRIVFQEEDTMVSPQTGITPQKPRS